MKGPLLQANCSAPNYNCHWRVFLVGLVAMSVNAWAGGESVGVTQEEIRVQRPPAAAPAAGTCKQGYVWREAFSGDHVCVKPEVRTQARQDNGRAKQRVQPGGGAYGPDTCRQGYVWREARANDHVCVKPEVREQSRQDNLNAKQRIAH